MEKPTATLCRRCGSPTPAEDLVRVRTGPWGSVCPDCAMELTSEEE